MGNGIRRPGSRSYGRQPQIIVNVDPERFREFESDVKRLTWEDLEAYTDDFSAERFIGKTQYGNVYRGTDASGKEVTVKVWADHGVYHYFFGGNLRRLETEIKFLILPGIKDHPIIAKLLGFCLEGRNKLGLVYDLKSKNTVHDLIPSDEFSWKDRISVAYELANLLAFFHAHQPPYVVCNISAAHIMLDQDNRPVLIDFGLMDGGVLGHEVVPAGCIEIARTGCMGYFDFRRCNSGEWRPSNDVFAFGVLLIALLCKKDIDDESFMKAPETNSLAIWARSMVNKQEENGRMGMIVRRSMREEAVFSARVEVTMLAVDCVAVYGFRPSALKIVDILGKLLSV